MGRHSIGRATRRMRNKFAAHDAGSATMAGVALVCAAALVLGLIAAGGNIVLRRGQARTVADLAAVGAAQALWYGETETPCVLAGHIASANGGAIESCMVDGDDVQVRARVATQVPFVRHVTAQARAGPRPCAATEAVQHAQARGHSACTGPCPRPIRVMQPVF
ncbi:pilus biosynthesis protein TadE [Bifidobacterium pseudolongum subsp. globosum]|uniref:Rv3654c family TadE-like protein n=1 Tax=Bifidobacterium pseudolongum TaxID=1694 RepID=UPI000C70E1F3|nr:Rv3654c family TadE-like protein [Bifidobacterium pseudolongum]PKU98363.1 pilus biosynthesis protein TadE [Bifidobacterium pseudolongum subsp. globosum]RYQ02939.1 pilus biosynthesis protein TadE [Bifidobacterium pseudolongum subsp. globosum]